MFRFLVLGIIFGIIMTKSEAVSWFRIQEMFHFDSIHMYGIIGTAVIAGALGILLLKRMNVQSVEGNSLKLDPKKMEVKRLIFGGFVFGLGWAMTGACPGPLYTLIGHGIWVIPIIIVSALLGTLTYGALQDKLPH